MVNGLLQRNRMAANGFIALLILLLWTAQAGAALLKDIRVGEHETFTRIVFELDTRVDSRQVFSGKDGELAVFFIDTFPDLVRKISTERAPNIENLRIRTEKHRLAVSFRFICWPEKVESSFIEDPPRFVVDVHPQDRNHPFVHADALTHANYRYSGQEIAPAEPIAIPQESAPQPEMSVQRQSLPLQMEQASPIEASRPTAAGGPHATASETVPQPPAYPPAAVVRSGPDHSPLSSPPPASKRSRLQYYLIIALIVISLTVLILLSCIMLSFRNEWKSGKRQILNTKEYLKRQDERIASLNARIKEQLERYEAA